MQQEIHNVVFQKFLNSTSVIGSSCNYYYTYTFIYFPIKRCLINIIVKNIFKIIEINSEFFDFRNIQNFNK